MTKADSPRRLLSRLVPKAIRRLAPWNARHLRVVDMRWLPPLWEQRCLARAFEMFDVDCVFDVGANYGQCANVVLPGVREALSRALELGVKLFLFTNQSGVCRGYFTLADVDSVNRRMIDLIGLGDRPFDGICIAPEHPDAPPVYRKPSPRYILETLAAHAITADEAWMIGDAPTDWQAGRNAGVRVAAIVPESEDARVRDERRAASVPRYPGLLDWANDVLPGRLRSGAADPGGMA